MAAKTMEELLAQYGSTVKSFRRGQKIDAILTSITKNSATFDIVGKAEGVLSDNYFNESKDYVKNLKVGDKVSAVVINPETSDGVVLLSLRNAAYDSIWDRLKDIKEKGKIVTVKVTGVSGKGLTVDFENLSGYLPANNLGNFLQEEFEDLEGTDLKVKVIEIDKQRERLVFSERAVSEADEIKLNQKALDNVKEGEIYGGTVSQNTSFGSFVEISVPVKGNKEEVKIEGLVHVSEISWDKVKEPSSVLKPGEKIKVKVLGLRDGKLALSLKQAKDDPWKTISDKYKKETQVKGKVTKQSDYGMFVQLEPGVEGLVHITKIAPGTKYETGQEVNVYVEEIDPEQRKISLGMVLTAKPVNYR